MEITPAAIPDVLIIKPKKHGDHRGFFSETFKNAALREHGVTLDWVQDNHSFSAARGVVRGLHFQRAPKAQAKLLRVTRGAILDVAVDVRKASPSYGQHVAVELSADNWTQLYVPAGFAHGFCTLTENTEVLYKVSAEYGPAEEGGLLWNDPDIGIAWPISAGEATLSARDLEWPRFKDFVSPF
jgi:dTDP-4-dehydrorhamnose 3,5-epimerase